MGCLRFENDSKTPLVMFRFAFWLTLLVPAAGSIWLLWASRLLLGIPGEWSWPRQPAPDGGWLVVAVPAVVAAIYVWFVRFGALRIESASRASRVLLLLCLVAGGFAWLWCAQEAATVGYQLSKAGWVLYYPGPSGYFTEARNDERSTAEFLRGYEQKMSAGDVLHIGTHPPGLILFFRGLLYACRSSPALTNLALACEPDSVRASLDEIESMSRTKGPALTRPERATLWLAALAAQWLAALTVIPLYGLLRHTCGAQASWQAAAFWPGVPALAVFLPKSDAAFPCLAVLIVFLWLTGLERRSYLYCLLTGFCFWLALMLSLAFLPVAFLAGVLTAWKVYVQRDDTAALADPPGATGGLGYLPCSQNHALASILHPVLAAAIGFAVPCVALRVAAGINLPAVWLWNISNHAGFYRQFTRTYWKWLLVNPLEFALAAGTPLVALAAWGAYAQWRRGGWRSLAQAAAFAATWGALWISGKNSGEAARLWIFLAPFLVWIAGPLFDVGTGSHAMASGNLSSARMQWWAALALQLAISLAFATRIAGFHF